MKPRLAALEQVLRQAAHARPIDLSAPIDPDDLARIAPGRLPDASESVPPELVGLTTAELTAAYWQLCQEPLDHEGAGIRRQSRGFGSRVARSR